MMIKVYKLSIADEATLIGAFNAEDENAEDYAKMLRNACYLEDERDNIREHNRYFIITD